MTDSIIIAALAAYAIVGWLLAYRWYAALWNMRIERDCARIVAEMYQQMYHGIKAKALIRGPDGRIRKA